VPFGLGLDDADGAAVGVEQVVGRAALQRELAHGHAQAGGEVHVLEVLHEPAGLFELAVDLLARALFGRHGGGFSWGGGRGVTHSLTGGE
jgi:hypothetical protein